MVIQADGLPDGRLDNTETTFVINNIELGLKMGLFVLNNPPDNEEFNCWCTNID